MKNLEQSLERLEVSFSKVSGANLKFLSTQGKTAITLRGKEVKFVCFKCES